MDTLNKTMIGFRSTMYGLPESDGSRGTETLLSTQEIVRSRMRKDFVEIFKIMDKMTTDQRKYVIRKFKNDFDAQLKFCFEYVLPQFKQEYSSSGNDWYRTSALYAKSGNIHTDRRLNFNTRMAQGLSIPLVYLSEAVTAVASAFSTYLLYRSGKNIYHTINSTISGEQTLSFLSTIKTHIYEIISLLIILYNWYTGKCDTNQAMLMLAGLGGWLVGKQILLSTLLSILKPVPVHSTERETQGFEPTSLAQNLISILLLLGLGASSTIDAKSIFNSVKGLSAIILSVKTVENVFVNIITYLPDIIQTIMSYHIPAFSMYVKLSTDMFFRRFIEVTHELQSLSEMDIIYNSHNFARFQQQLKYIRNLIKSHNESKNLKQLVNIIPDIFTWYDKIANLARELGVLNGYRKMPYVIWISGDPGIGKSTMVRDLSKLLIGSMTHDDGENFQILRENDISRYVYNHNTSNKYFDGYNNQPIFVLNDYMQFASENEEQWLIRFADTNECPLEVSSVDNVATGVKGEVRFTSRFIIITSNITHLENSAHITSLDAFNRRRDIVLDMRWKSDRKKVLTFDNMDYSWADLIIKPNLPWSNAPMMAFDNIDDIKDYIMDQIDNFNSIGTTLEIPVLREFNNGNLVNTISRLNTVDAQFDAVMWRTWKSLSSFMDKDYFGIKFKYLLPLIAGTASATYMLYKTWVPSLVAKFTQSMSGDMATQRIKRALKPIVRTTMGNRQNDTELAQNIMNNVVRISTTIVDERGQHIKQVMWGWIMGGTLLVTPKHLWCRGMSTIQEGDEVILERNGVTTTILLEKKNLYLSQDEDLAVFNMLGHTPNARSKFNLILNKDYMIDEAGEDVILILPTMTNGKLVPTIVPTRAFMTDAEYMDEYGKVYPGRSIWQYNHRMVKGDCGAILCIKTPQGMKVAGIHVAGDSFSGNSEVLTTALLEDVCSHFEVKETQGFTTDAVLDTDEYFDAESDLDGDFYFLGKCKMPPYQKGETQIKKSPLYEVLQPHRTEPAVLSPSDKRMKEPCSPILKSIAKYGTTILPFDRDLMREAFEIVSSFYDPIKAYKLRVFSVDDAINSKYTPSLEKLDLSTSAGYPWNTLGKNKKTLIDCDANGIYSIKPELMNVLNKNENLLAKRTMFPYTLVTTLKDERVSISKVEIGKTRTFINFPVEYTILMRRYFDDFIDKETLFATEIGTTVGVNIYSSNWHALFLDLDAYDYTTDGDFKAFDGTIRPEFFKLYAKLVNKLYGDEYSNTRDMLVTGCCFAPIFVLDKVYMKLKGNPSGSRLTTSFNSFVNRMYVIMSMLAVLPKQHHNIKFFNDNIKMYAHGDDHIIGFNQVIEDYWDAHVLRKFMLEHGIEYTSSTKEAELRPYRPLRECYYLKSYFVYDKQSATYRAGLDKEVIQEMVSWQRDDNIKSTEMIVQTCQRYAYFWGKDYFSHIYNELEMAINKRHLSIKLIDYNSLDQYYRYEGQMDFSYI